MSASLHLRVLVAAVAVLLVPLAAPAEAAPTAAAFVQARIAVAEDHSCVITADGGVACWGRAPDPADGLPKHARPQVAQGVKDAVAIAADADETCVVTAAGAVRCWGAGRPVHDRALGSVASIAMHDGGMCAVRTDRTVVCEGSNATGQSTNVLSKGPVTMPVSDAVSVAAGRTHSCALTSAGRVICWGDNRRGQVGSTVPAIDQSFVAPTTVPLERPAVRVAAGTDHTCATLDDGTMMCWGANHAGQLGNGRADPSAVPHARPAAVTHLLPNAAGVATKGSSSCVWSKTGTVSCWGAGANLGRRNTQSDGTVPRRVLNLFDVSEVAQGRSHSCALLATGAVKCWGETAYGETGLVCDLCIEARTPRLVEGVTAARSATPEVAPEAVEEPGSAWVEVSAGYQHSCGLRADGTVWCWGRNTGGEIGTGEATAANVLTPTRVTGLPKIRDVNAGAFNTCAIDVLDRAFCWGGNGNQVLGLGIDDAGALRPQLVDGLPRVASIAQSYGACASTYSGALYCWGPGEWTGLGTTETVDYPRRNDRLQDISDVSVGWRHACASSRGGSMWCWGYNDYGQIGNGALSPQVPHLTPYQVGISGVKQVSAGWHHSCALVGTGTPWCWGTGTATGRPAGVPTSPRTLPGPVVDASPATAVRTYGWHTCAEMPNGEARCWGENGYGQLGVAGSSQVSHATPQRISLDGTRQLSTGLAHACAVVDGGELYCWGHNINGQLGHGTESDAAPPARVAR